MIAPGSLERWIEIDLDALEANAQHIREHLPEGVKIMAVLKADAYGMGLIPAGRLLSACADMLAVSTLEEGMALRKAGIDKPILVFFPVNEQTAPFFRLHNLIATVVDMPSLADLAESGNEEHPFHLKINTGMNRLGASPGEGLELAQMAEKMASVRLEGIYSHFASAAKKAVALRQLSCFNGFLDDLRSRGINYGLAHMANSAAVLTLPQSYFDMVRPGTILYGQSPVSLPGGWKLSDPWACKCRIISTRQVEKGEPVGYGGDFVAKNNIKIGVLPIGYADGFAMEVHARPSGIKSSLYRISDEWARSLYKKQRHYAIYEKGRLLPVGRVSMQMTTIDISNTSLAKGDIVSVFLRRTCASAAITRLYYRQGELVGLRSLADNSLIEAEKF